MRRAVAVLGLALGCSGVQASPSRARPAAPPSDPNASFVTPARWDYHPPTPVTALSVVKLPDGGCLFTAEGGQRWSAATTKQVGNRVTCSGPAEASLSVAPEELTSALRRADGSWLYVGETGALYEASEPLGAFSRTVPAPEPLAKVTGAGAAVLATTLEGKLLRWEEDKGWRAAAPSPALAGARVFDLAVGSGGRILALGFPEALFASEDSGATWTATSAPTVGARRLGSTSGGDLGAQGVLESVVWRGAAFVKGPEKLPLPATSIAVDVGHAPSAGAVQAARAVLDGDRYTEVVRPENEGETWLLARGRLEGRLETTPLPDSGRCSNVRLGARGKVVFIACVMADGSDIAAELSRSTDGGATWSEPLRLLTPDTDQIFIAVAPDGAALVTGLCRASDAAGACKPTSPLLLRDAHADAPDGGKVDRVDRPDRLDAGAPRPALRAVPPRAPQHSGLALAPIFGAGGHAANFLGRRGKDDRIGLFVSHDGGETFSPRTLQPAVLTHTTHRSPEDDEPADTEAQETFDLDENSVLRPGDDGAISLMVVRSRGSSAYVTADDDGRVLQVAGPPVDDEGNPIDVVLAGYGRRVLALPLYLPNDGTSGAFWESLDGGANWDKQSMPQALVREYTRGNNMLVACAAAGCLMGDTVTRVGWGGAGEAGAPERPPETPTAPTPAVLTPIVCDLSPSTKWSRIEDLFVSSPNAVPQVHDMMRGRSVWSALTLDRATGALGSVSATLPESGEGEARVVRRALLGARGAHTATAISPTQVEGYAVARVAYPVDAHGQLKVGAPLRNLELAWENYLEGTEAHARVADPGALQRDDVEHTDGGDALRTGMLSITSRGLFVRVHHAHVKTGDEIFVDPAGRVERYAAAPWPASGPLGALDFRTDAAAVGGDLLDLGLVAEPDRAWSAAVIAKRGPGGAWGYVADALLPQRAGTTLLAYTTWASSGKAPVGVTALVADPGHAHAWAHYLGFRGDGTFWPAAPVTTLYDLGDRPRPCTLADRAATPRAAMIFKLDNSVLFPGARHPVLVQEPRAKNAVGVAEPQVFLTSSAVVHGTPASPCLDGFQADSVVKGALTGAVIPGDLARSWLFRTTRRAAPPRRGHGDDGARVPPDDLPVRRQCPDSGNRLVPGGHFPALRAPDGVACPCASPAADASLTRRGGGTRATARPRSRGGAGGRQRWRSGASST